MNFYQTIAALLGRHHGHSACRMRRGPSEAEYVAACLKEGEMGANKALRKEMGVNSAAPCKCAATEARSSLSATRVIMTALGNPMLYELTAVKEKS